MPLKIMPHGRLQEWVAEEKGFFTAEGLDYTFLLNSGDYGIHSVQRDESGEVRSGAFETFGAGRDGADVSCACHWATNAAAGERSGQLVTTAYSVAPCAIVVPPESPIRRAEDLGIDKREATRDLLAARSIKDLVRISGRLYRPPKRFRNW